MVKYEQTQKKSVIIHVTHFYLRFYLDNAKILFFPAQVLSVYIWRPGRTVTLFHYGNIWNPIKEEADINGQR